MQALPIDTDSFGFIATDLARLIRAEFDRRIAAAGLGLTAGETRALVHVARAGPVRQSVLADRMGVEAMTLCAFLDRLEASGLVTRTVDPTDRRAKLADLTDRADDVLVKIRAVTDGIRKDAAGGLDPAVWGAMLSGIKAARTNLASAREAALHSEATSA